MTSHSSPPRNPDRTLRSAQDLVRAGLVAPERLEALERVAERYAVAITPGLAEAIAAAPDGPLARQFLPQEAELSTTSEERADPIGDDAHSPVPGIVHRYPDRVLLKAVSVCAVYCRFCFRREAVGPGKAQALSPEALGRALAYIAARPEVWEVILTGGDPLVLSPRRLASLGARLAAIEHVKVMRVHTRVPIVEPARVTPALVRALDVAGTTTWLVVHVNHADELTPAVRDALGRLARAGIPLLSQSVLLRGVNDDAATLAALFRALVECRVKPYYLHHGDLAPGTAHFRTGLAEGQELMRNLRGDVSGLCQPTYMLDIPGGQGKVPVGPCYLTETREGTEVEDWRGARHTYSGSLHPPAGNNGIQTSPREGGARLPSPSRGGPSRSAGANRGGGRGAEGDRVPPPTPPIRPSASLGPPSPQGGRQTRNDEVQPILKRRLPSPGTGS